MSKIILYDDTLEFGKTAFITPNDKIIITDVKHEIFAQDYCEGDINKLTKDELILYKYWLEQVDFNKARRCSDFLVDVLGFDKIVKNVPKTITTTTSHPHVRVYNYYLKDWNIDVRKRTIFNEETQMFEYEYADTSFMMGVEDRRMESEINEIKSKVKTKDRHHFFK